MDDLKDTFIVINNDGIGRFHCDDTSKNILLLTDKCLTGLDDTALAVKDDLQRLSLTNKYRLYCAFLDQDTRFVNYREHIMNTSTNERLNENPGSNSPEIADICGLTLLPIGYKLPFGCASSEVTSHSMNQNILSFFPHMKCVTGNVDVIIAFYPGAHNGAANLKYTWYPDAKLVLILQDGLVSNISEEILKMTHALFTVNSVKRLTDNKRYLIEKKHRLNHPVLEYHWPYSYMEEQDSQSLGDKKRLLANKPLATVANSKYLHFILHLFTY